MRPETRFVRTDPSPGDPYAPSATPIYQTATFRLDEGGELDYTRSGNPTRRVLEDQAARIEGGTRAFAFASGMAAIAAVTSLVPSGAEILAGTDLYGGTYRLLSRLLPGRGVHVHYTDTTDERAISMALQSRPRLILVETPTNPFQRITDLGRLAQRAHARGCLVAVDNSLMSPYLQNPLERGADLVVHSATKFLGGHSDVTAGLVVVKDDELAETLGFFQNATGTALAPFEAWLLERGIKTLALRVARQQRTAKTLASFLQSHPHVKAVHYAGLAEHPGRSIHARQARGGGSVIAFETGSLELSRRLVRALGLFPVTVSFGGVGSSVCLPAEMSHASIPKEVRAERSFPDDLVRLSVGIEHPDDLLDDLKRAFSTVFAERRRA